MKMSDWTTVLVWTGEAASAIAKKPTPTSAMIA
jgi:hypothetical protein